MDYYEELGLSRTASEEDIRKAFRTISKVLHPDLQTDPATRDAAALQMRRLNAMVDVLLDPHRRHEYDRSLRPPALTPAPIIPPRPPGGLRLPERPTPVWLRAPAVGVSLLVLGALVVVMAVIWFQAGDMINFQSVPDRSASSSNPTPPAAKTGAPAQRQETAQLEPVTRQVPPATRPNRHEEPSPEPSYTRMPSTPASALVPSPEPPAPQEKAVAPAPQRIAETKPPTPAPAVQTPPPAPQPKETSQPAGLDGLWVYAPAPAGGNRSVVIYAPEFIQLRIRAHDDTVYGEYSSRYIVPDKALSSEVSFTFQGKMEGTSNSFGWRADDGTLGVVSLHMVNANSLQVNWRVTSFGSHIGLGAGTAVLIRRLAS